MTVTNTSLLGLALPTTGTESGVWGDDVNNGLTILVDMSVAGTNNITQDSDITLAVSNGNNSSSFTSTATNSTVAQYSTLNCTGARGAIRNIIAPASSRTFVVINNTTGGFAIVIKKSGGTGVSIAPNETAIVYYDSVTATDYVKVSSTVNVSSFSAGTTGFTPSTATTGAVTLAGTLATTNGGTGLTSYTANGVVYASSTSALATGSGLTFNGTTFSTTNDASIHGLTVGQGAGSVSNNTALGNGTLSNGSTTGGRNVAIGFNAGNTLSSGAQNTLIGSYCGTGLTTGTQNIGIGDGALTGNSTGATGSYNVGIGALTLLTSGSSNTAIGYQALQSNNTASYNTAVGYQSLQANITGTYQVALGYRSAYNATASYSVYIGQGAGYSHSTSSENNGSVFIGDGAGGIGGGLTGHDNTYIGGSSGSAMTSGSKNTILGQYTGNQNGSDIRTLNNIVVISDGDGYPYLNLNRGSGTARGLAFDGTEFFPTTDNTISCGFSSFRWSVVYSATALINTSDRNLKQDIADLDNTEKRVAIAIKSLIKKYRFKDSVAEKGDKARIHVGAIAQEVASAFEAENLDPTRYGLFCSDTWYEVDGKKLNAGGEFYKSTDESVVSVTQLGLRYDELLAFVISAM